MKIYAYLMSGRMVACAFSKKCVRNKKPAICWKDTRDCGGIYDRLENWMRHVIIEQSEKVRFELNENNN